MRTTEKNEVSLAKKNKKDKPLEAWGFFVFLFCFVLFAGEGEIRFMCVRACVCAHAQLEFQVVVRHQT